MGISGVIVLAAACAGLALIHYTGNESARRAMFVEVARELESFHKQHRAYPRTLEELRITRFPDGSGEGTWRTFRYSSDGGRFTLESSRLWGETLHLEGN